MLETASSVGSGLASISHSDDAHTVTAPARKRPLRTYGRRTIPTAQDTDLKSSPRKTEDTAVEQAIASPPPRLEVDSDTIVVATDDTETPSPSPPSERREPSKPSRSSILSYFKPISQPLPEVAKDSEANDPESQSLSPPPSPRPISIPRKRRRLTTRPGIIYKHDTTPVGENQRQEDSRPVPIDQLDAPLKDKRRRLQDISPKGAHGAPFITVTTPPDALLQRNLTSSPSGSSSSDGDDNHQNALHETSRSLLNRIDNSKQQHHSTSDTAEDHDMDEKGSSAGERCQRIMVKKKKQKALVQTTLSLAVNPGPGFTICKDCGILYNHLNENDRKEHKRRHAAYVRGKVKSAS